MRLTSADAVIVVGALEKLFPVVGSVVEDETDAVFVMNGTAWAPG